MKSLIVTISLPFLILSCSTRSDKVKSKQQQSDIDSSSRLKAIRGQYQKSDTLIVDRKSAVFFQPDSNQIEKRISEIGEESFINGADDFVYYMQTSHDFIDSAKLKIMDAKNSKFLKFIGADRANTIVKLDTLPTLWGVFLFDPITKPRLIDITVVGDEYKSYFK